MINKIAAAALIAAASLSFVTVAQAGDFPATPMNSGPLVMTGMGPVGALFNVGVTPVNVVTSVLVPPAAAAPMAGEPMMRRHHRHMRHMMMKKKM